MLSASYVGHRTFDLGETQAATARPPLVSCKMHDGNAKQENGC